MSLKLNFPTLDFLIILTRSRVGIKKKDFVVLYPIFIYILYLLYSCVCAVQNWISKYLGARITSSFSPPSIIWLSISIIIIHKLLIHGHLICNTRFYLVDTLISGHCAANMYYLGGHRPVSSSSFGKLLTLEAVGKINFLIWKLCSASLMIV